MRRSRALVRWVLSLYQGGQFDAAFDAALHEALHAARQIGRVHVRLRQWPQARAAFVRSLSRAWQRHHAQALAHGLLHLPIAMLMTGQADQAAKLHGFATRHWDRLFHGLNRIEASEMRRCRRLLRLALGPVQAEALRVHGRGLALSEAVSLALQAQR